VAKSQGTRGRNLKPGLARILDVDVICLVVAGVIRSTLTVPEFTLAWNHSVQKTRWEERYRVDGGALNLIEARVQGSGAGMEPPPDARFDHGAWTWQPNTRHLELRLTQSAFAGDYAICADGHCTGMSDLTGPVDDGTIVTVRVCPDVSRRGSAGG
jgi:hypothetical protein